MYRLERWRWPPCNSASKSIKPYLQASFTSTSSTFVPSVSRRCFFVNIRMNFNLKISCQSRYTRCSLEKKIRIFHVLVFYFYRVIFTYTVNEYFLNYAILFYIIDFKIFRMHHVRQNRTTIKFRYFIRYRKFFQFLITMMQIDDSIIDIHLFGKIR